MSTQVATSHTVHTRAPLKVPKRPAKNHVALGIQKFIPYAVVFLLSLVIYSALRPSTTIEYPPYSPERFGEDVRPQADIGRFARDLINKRQKMFEEAMSKSKGEAGAKAAEWKLWSERKANELQQKIEEAKIHEEKMAPRAQEVVSEMLQKSAAKETVDSIKHVGEDIKEHVMDAADWWKEHGEQLAENVQAFKDEKVASTQQFAYDAMYAWNHKAEAMKEAAKEKLGEAKDVAQDTKEVAQEKFEELKESAKETLDAVQDKLGDAKDLAKDKFEMAKDVSEQLIADASERLQETWNTVGEKAVEMGNLAQEKLGEAKELASEAAESASQKVREVVDNVVGEVGDRMEGVKEGLTQAAFDFNNRLEGSPKLMPLSKLDDNTSTNKLASLVQRVKAGLMQDADVRHAMSMKEDWSKVSLAQKVDDITQQICLLGDEVADGVLHKLQLERSQGHC